MSKIKCYLTDEELINKVKDWVSKLCKSGGDAWTLRVPADPDYDPDILITELCERFKNDARTLDESPLPESQVGQSPELKGDVNISISERCTNPDCPYCKGAGFFIVKNETTCSSPEGRYQCFGDSFVFEWAKVGTQGEPNIAVLSKDTTEKLAPKRKIRQRKRYLERYLHENPNYSYESIFEEGIYYALNHPEEIVAEQNTYKRLRAAVIKLIELCDNTKQHHVNVFWELRIGAVKQILADFPKE